MSERQIVDIAIKKITAGERFRKVYKNIPDLIESIKNIGLQNPIILTPDMVLVSGGRRLEAHKVMGSETIPARIVKVENLLDAEIDENNQRESFTISEKVAIADTLAETIGERRGRKAQVTDNKEDKNPENSPELGTESREFIAKRAGLGSSATYRQAKKVLQSAIPEVVEAMDNGIVSVNYAHRISQAPKRKQLTLLNDAKSDAETDGSELDEFNKSRRKAKRKAKAHVPNSPTAEPIYNVIRVSPNWANELETDIAGLPVADYVSSAGIVCLECTNDKIATALQMLDVWGFTFKAMVTVHNAKGKVENHREYINQMTSHVVIGQIDADICGARVTQISPVYNRQNPAESLIDIIAELCPDKKDTRLDMSSPDPRTGWKIWKIDYADPCVLCKAAHTHCNKCCAKCKEPCNAQQACRAQKTFGKTSKKDC